MDHELMTMWLSVDPMADKYPSISPYAYCAWNPIILTDPNGMIIDSATMNSEIKELLNPESRKYNGDFASVIQKLRDDPTTLYRFCVWNEPRYDEKEERVINGELQSAGKNEDIWVADICYFSEGDHKHRTLFEETYHAYQLLTGDLGFVYTISNECGTYGVFARDDEDEISAKNWAYNISRGWLRRLLGWEYNWTSEDLRRDGYKPRINKTAYDVYNDFLRDHTDYERRGFGENGWIQSDVFHFRQKQ